MDVIGKIPKVPVNIGRSAHFITKSASVLTLSTFCIVLSSVVFHSGKILFEADDTAGIHKKGGC